jgi:glycosyltransferase 2 family protein
MGRHSRAIRILFGAIAFAAIAFVVWVVPLRDRCWDAHAPASTRITVTRMVDGCILHATSGDVLIPASECARLRCEPGVASTLSRARLVVVAGLLALYAAGTLAWAARWRSLLAFAGVDMPVWQVWRVSIEAQAGGVLLPGGVGGDALRVVSVLRRPTGAAEARSPPSIVIASVLLDRAIGLAVLAALSASLGLAWGGLRAGPLAFLLAAIPVALCAGLLVLRRAPLQRIGWLVEGQLRGWVGPVLEYVRDARAPRAMLRAAAFSVFVAAIQLAVIRGLVFALGGAPSTEKWVYVGSAMAFMVAALPVSPGGWGTSDAAWVFFLGLAGLSAGTALAVCLLYRLFWYLSGVVGAILYVVRPSVTPGTTADAR